MQIDSRSSACVNRCCSHGWSRLLLTQVMLSTISSKRHKAAGSQGIPFLLPLGKMLIKSHFGHSSQHLKHSLSPTCTWETMNPLQTQHCPGSQQGLKQTPLTHCHLLTPAVARTAHNFASDTMAKDASMMEWGDE